MINVIASIHIRDGRLPEFIDIFKANRVTVLAEEGCLEYLPAIDFASGLPPQVMDDHVVTVIEKWSSLEALKAHLASPHMLAYKKAVKDLVANVSFKVLTEA